GSTGKFEAETGVLGSRIRVAPGFFSGQGSGNRPGWWVRRGLSVPDGWDSGFRNSIRNLELWSKTAYHSRVRWGRETCKDGSMAVRRDCMRGQIRRELLRRIIEGHYKPGDRLVELQIAREFDTSQAPVREALRELEAVRLVETETYR